MSFLAPAFLLGLAALAIPVFIHLIQRERKRVIEFPSLMFVRRIPYQSVRRRRIRHWLLLMMRAAAILMIVAAFARSEEHTSELQSHHDLVCRLLLEKKKTERETTAEHYRHV